MTKLVYSIPTRIIIVEDMPEELDFIDVGGIRLMRRGVDILAFYKASPTHIWVDGQRIRVQEVTA